MGKFIKRIDNMTIEILEKTFHYTIILASLSGLFFVLCQAFDMDGCLTCSLLIGMILKFFLHYGWTIILLLYILNRWKKKLENT